MTEKIISFAGQSLTVVFPQQAAEIINFTFFDFPQETSVPNRPSLEVTYDKQKRLFSLSEDGQQIGADLAPAELSLLLLSRSTYSLLNDLQGGTAIHGAAVHRKNRAVLMPGKSGIGKSILTSRLLSMGYNYLTDELVYFPDGADYFTALSRPLHINETGRQVLEGFCSLDDQQHPFLQSEKTTLFSHRVFDEQPISPQPELSLLLFIEQSNKTPLAINSQSPGQAAKRLMESVVNARNTGVDSFKHLASISRNIPAILLKYADIEQLDVLLKPIIDFVLENRCSPASLQGFIQAFQTIIPAPAAGLDDSKADVPLFPMPEATKKGKKRKLTIGMATYDDYDGVYFSVQALRMYHSEIAEECELLVVDNNPTGPCAQQLKRLDQQIDGYRYVPLPDVHGTAVRDYIFHHAAGDYVVCMDCHVFIVPGAIEKLLNYFAENPDSRDLLQGPMIYDDLVKIATHLEPSWREGMYGTWATDVRGNDLEGGPFEIPMQGLGVFACRKDAWQRFNPRFRGFGGEEGYIHEKFRQAGSRTLCLPFLRWMHRFARPMGVPYPLRWKDRIWNYWLGCAELNLDIDPMKDHFCDMLGSQTAQTLFDEVEDEIASPFSFFDAIYCITLSTNSERWAQMEKRFQALGINRRVRSFAAIETPENHHVGCALSHRAIIRSAKQQRLQNVLIFEDDAIFLDNTLQHLGKSIAELKTRSWNLFYLGGHRWGGNFEKVADCSFLLKASCLTCTHALAYNNTVYDQILEDLPESVEEMEPWIQDNLAIDQYLRKVVGALLASPTVASQVELLPQEQERHRNRFTLADGDATAAPIIPLVINTK